MKDRFWVTIIQWGSIGWALNAADPSEAWWFRVLSFFIAGFGLWQANQYLEDKP